MNTIDLTINDQIATLTLMRGKVHAVNPEMVAELSQTLNDLRTNDAVRSLILTGEGNFFSFGLDVPELYPLTPDEMTSFLTNFCAFKLELFTFPKPVISAINGHCIAAACMLAVASDRRIMVEGKALIGLNEIRIGASVFAGSAEIVKCAVGHKNAETILIGGAMHTGVEALQMGLVESLHTPANLIPQAVSIAKDLGGLHPDAFSSIKALLRNPIAERIRLNEKKSIERFVEIWYTNETRELLKLIAIR